MDSSALLEIKIRCCK